MKKFSKIIACLSALSVCFSAVNFNVSAVNFNPYEYEKADFSTGMGDINGDGMTDAVDAGLILSDYAWVSSGNPEHLLTENQLALCDVFNDNYVDASDASFLMTKYAYDSVTTKNTGYKAADGGFTAEEITDSQIKPQISISNVILSCEEAQRMAANGEPVSVDVCISGNVDNAYSCTGFHVNYSPYIKLATRFGFQPDITTGAAVKSLTTQTECNEETSDIFLATTGYKNSGQTGVMYTINFTLPENIKGGEFFPVNIEYHSNETTGDLFTNVENDMSGKLMQAYLFTQGITNGGIQIQTTDGETPYIPAVTYTTITTTRPSTTAPVSRPTVTTTTTVKPTAPPVTTSTSKGGTSETVKTGDSNGDGKVSIADAVMIMQALSNPAEFTITKNCADAADVVDKGNGLTSMDALALQMVDINLLSIDDLPITSEVLQQLMQ